MAELADAQASGACGSNIVRVQVPLPALFFCADLFSHVSIYHTLPVVPGNTTFHTIFFPDSCPRIPNINYLFYQKSVDNFNNFMYSISCR